MLQKKKSFINNDLQLDIANYRSITVIVGITSLFLLSLQLMM